MTEFLEIEKRGHGAFTIASKAFGFIVSMAPQARSGFASATLDS